ncbi:MAG: c-type cytochrome, partial [Planctomycetia bacterium]|nr:c-type cytochrome [Planctomycetia bacterium]
VRFLAVKWIADEKLTRFRPQIVAGSQDRNLNVRMFFAYSAALARLDNQDASEGRMTEFFLTRLADEKSSPTLRILALQMVPPTHKKLTLELLTGLLDQQEPALQIETVRALNEHPSPQRTKLLLDVSRNRSRPSSLRAEAVVGLAEQSAALHNELLQLLQEDDATLRSEVLRALVQNKYSRDERAQLEKLAEQQPARADLVARALGKPFAKDRPKLEDLDGWLARLEGPSDPAAGRRVFFHAKLAACSRCHRVEGRGQDIGPDLSTIGQMERRRIVEAIFQPNSSIAPHYQVWAIVTQAGKAYTGMLLRTNLDEYTYVDPKGELFKLRTTDIAESQPVPTSIMPTGLPDILTDQELRDLLAYLTSRR